MSNAVVISDSLKNVHVLTLLSKAQVLIDGGVGAEGAFRRVASESGIGADSEQMTEFVAYGMSLLNR